MNENKTAQELRQSAARHDQEANESFERSDTDGFMSQWASGVVAQEERLQADIVENGGKWEFQALFDLDGNLVAAKKIETQYGWSWGIFADDSGRGRFTGWFNESKARKEETRIANDAKKGYYVGSVLAPAKAVLRGRSRTSVYAVAVRLDGGWSRDVEIVDNGK